jgi:hypothetical protein
MKERQAAEPDAADRARDAHRGRDPETGRFVSGEEPGGDPPEATPQDEPTQDPAGETPAEEQDTDPPAAAEPSGGETDDPDAAAEKPQRTLVQIPSEHPARQGDIDAIPVETPEQERTLRALINGTYYRRQEVEERDQRIEALERENIQLKSTQSAAERWKQTPQYKAAVERYHEIRDTVGAEAASQFWKGVQRDFETLVNEETEKNWGEVEQRRGQEQARAWVNDAWNRNSSTVPQEVRQLPHFGRMFQQAVRLFDHALAEGHHPDVRTVEDQHNAFGRFFRALLLQDTQVRDAFSKVSSARTQPAGDAPKDDPAAKAAEKKAEEKVRREFAEGRRNSPPNPLAGVGHGSGPDRAAPAPDQGKPKGPVSPHRVEQMARSSARERARQRFGSG